MSTKRILKSQEKDIVSKVYKRMKYEAQFGYVQKLTDARWRTSQAVGYSESSISRILKEEREAGKDSTTTEKVFKNYPKRKRNRKKGNIYDYDLGVLRQTVMSFQANTDETPSLKKLKEVLAERINFNGCVESMRMLLRELGYKFVGKKVFIEKHEIQIARFKYLKQMKKYRDEGRYIVFTDECCIRVNTAKANGRIMVIHAGGSDGFVQNASLVFQGASTSGDYHDNVSEETYKTWLTKQLLPNLPKNSVVVLDNAPYHNELSEKPPGVDSDRKAMETWLRKKDIPFEESFAKIELYDLVLKNKEKYKNYEIDSLIKSEGCEIIRQPPHHPELNAIDRIWRILKENIANKNADLTIDGNKELIKQELQNIDKSTWVNACQTVVNTEKEYIQWFGWLDTDTEIVLYVN